MKLIEPQRHSIDRASPACACGAPGATRRHRRAFIMTDVAVGLAILGMIAAVLASAVGRERAAELRLAGDRAAARVAEHVLLDLQLRQPVPRLPDHVHVVVQRLHDVEPSAPGYAWAAVEAKVGNGRSAMLLGLVPDEMLPKIQWGQQP